MDTTTIAVGVVSIGGAYLVGGIPWGVVLARLVGGPDPRTQGSGRTGGANVLRVLGPRVAAVAAILDLLKGSQAAAGEGQSSPGGFIDIHPAGVRGGRGPGELPNRAQAGQAGQMGSDIGVSIVGAQMQGAIALAALIPGLKERSMNHTAPHCLIGH